MSKKMADRDGEKGVEDRRRLAKHVQEGREEAESTGATGLYIASGVFSS
jgi:hypothetical protein